MFVFGQIPAVFKHLQSCENLNSLKVNTAQSCISDICWLASRNCHHQHRGFTLPNTI